MPNNTSRLFREALLVIYDAFVPIERRKFRKALRLWMMDGGCIGIDPIRMDRKQLT